MPVFAVTTMRGPKWDVGRGIREQRAWTEHADFADKLVEDGRVLLGGPIDDPDERVIALIAMDAPSASAVHDVFGDDPWVRLGILAIKDVRPWTIWLRPK
jgi:uncharacterized protein YciI